MKRVILFFATLLSFAACSLNEVDFGEQMYYSDIYGRWVFRTTAVTNTGYSSIELTEGRYFFAQKKDGSIVYGRYSKTDDFQFTLDGCAVLDVTEYNESSLTFNMTLNGATEPVSASAYSATDVADDADEESQYDDNIYAVWELYKIEGDECGCECDDSCNCKDANSGAICTMEGCNCLCNENRVQIRYMFLSKSGVIITIDNREDSSYSRWYWKDSISTEGEIYSSTTDEKIITIESVSSHELRIVYSHPNGELYDVWFVCKTSGPLDI